MGFKILNQHLDRAHGIGNLAQHLQSLNTDVRVLSDKALQIDHDLIGLLQSILGNGANLMYFGTQRFNLIVQIVDKFSSITHCCICIPEKFPDPLIKVFSQMLYILEGLIQSDNASLELRSSHEVIDGVQYIRDLLSNFIDWDVLKLF